MFNNLEYAFDAETGEIINNKKDLTKILCSKPKRKMKSRLDKLQSRHDALRDKLDLNFVRQMLLNCQFEVLECVLKLRKLENKKNIPTPLKINLGKLEGVYLSSLIVYRYLLDNGRVNHSQLELQLSFLETLENEKWLMQIPEFNAWFLKIKAYLKQYFK